MRSSDENPPRGERAVIPSRERSAPPGAERLRIQPGIWFRPLAWVGGVATSLFLLSFLADLAIAPEPRSLSTLLLAPNGKSAIATLGAIAQVVGAILGIAITVVSIVVEMAANRYTPRISELFFRDPVNSIVMGLFVVSCLQCLWVILEFDPAFTPRVGIVVTMALTTGSLLALLPYFAYVFASLKPEVVIDRIRAAANDAMTRLDGASSPAEVAFTQLDAANGVEQLTGISLTAVKSLDTGLSVAAVDALRTLGLRYLLDKRGLPAAWFEVSDEIRRNPDFVSMAPEVVDDLGRSRLWFEMKLLRQYETLYAESLNEARGVNYRIAINTRQLAEQARAQGDTDVVELCVRFFNTYIRATLNAEDVRTAYNVLNQYRLLGESALREGDTSLALDLARYFRYYGQIASSSRLSFILEVVAYDLCGLCQVAHTVSSEAHELLLRTFLEVDKEPETIEQERTLRGVRKAQVKLATYYLSAGDRSAARTVYDDMKGERPERLVSIREELLATQRQDYWEIIDRGANFDYLPPERRAKLEEFFSWFDERSP